MQSKIKETKEKKDREASLAKCYFTPPIIEADFMKYAAYLADHDLTEEEALHMIGTLWAILHCIVDQHFGVLPPPKTCGEPCQSSAPDVSPVLVDVVRCDDPKMAKLSNSFGFTTSEMGK